MPGQIKLVCLLGLFIVAFFATTNASSPPRPVIAPQFQSDITLDVLFGHVVIHSEAGQLYSDTINEKSRLFIPSIVPGNPQWVLNTTIYDGDDYNYYDTNEVCRKYPGDYSNLFDWVRYGRYQGQQFYLGQTCDVWTFSYTSDGFADNVTLWAVGNVPVAQNISMTFNGFPNVLYFTYSNFQPQSYGPNEPIFTVPDRCFGNGPICPNGTVQTIPMLRYHSEEDWSLNDKNTADLYGDAYYMCLDLTSGATKDQLVSLFEVQVNTSWGRYGKCNEGYCLGSVNNTVGRTATMGIKPFGGQCANNSDTGNWYSLDSQAECQGDDPIGTNGCAWKEVKRIKTVEMSCLTGLGLLDACYADPTIPVADAANVIAKGIYSCPPVNPSNTTTVTSSKSGKSRIQNDLIETNQPMSSFDLESVRARMLNRRDLQKAPGVGLLKQLLQLPHM